MSNQPTGEWTAESVMKMFGWRYKKRAEAVAKAHNAALAAERERIYAGADVVLRSEYEQLRDQLAVLTRENNGRDQREAEYAAKMVAEIQARDKQLAALLEANESWRQLHLDAVKQLDAEKKKVVK